MRAPAERQGAARRKASNEFLNPDRAWQSVTPPDPYPPRALRLALELRQREVKEGALREAGGQRTQLL